MEKSISRPHRLTVRPVLQKFVDFSNPTRTNVSEIVVWFGNVEVIAAERIGRETVTYVANIYKYHVGTSWSSRHPTARRRPERRSQRPSLSSATFFPA